MSPGTGLETRRGRSNFVGAMIELRAIVELKDTIVVAMPKLVGERFYMCIIRVKYECKAPRCSCYKVFDHVLDECPKNIGFDVAKNLKNPRQAARGVSVGPKVGFKEVKQVYKPVSSKNTAKTSGKKKQDAVSRKESSKLASKGAMSDGFSSDEGFFHVTSTSTSTTPIVERIDARKINY
nr:hypothetical protein [Tanacetum cinerariifolium]